MVVEFSSHKRFFQVSLVLVSVVWLFACKGENSGSSGTLSLSITDAPVDYAEQVVVQFTGAEIKSANGESIQVDYSNPKSINLLALQGGLRATLIEQLDLDVGTYPWIRLKVNAEADGIMDSYIRINGADYELRIPSGSNNGLKLNTPFRVGDGELVDFTIDFDLRASVQQPRGQVGPSGDPVYYLRPTLRLIDTNESGVIRGIVDPLVFDSLTCSAPDVGYGVYLFGGSMTPDDIDGVQPDPTRTTKVSLNASSEYVYTLSFIMPGDYTIAATCTADVDEPDMNDVIEFVGVAPVTVTAGASTPHDFIPAVP